MGAECCKELDDLHIVNQQSPLCAIMLQFSQFIIIILYDLSKKVLYYIVMPNYYISLYTYILAMCWRVLKFEFQALCEQGRPASIVRCHAI